MRQRLESALKVIAANHDDADITISSLCRIAKVNRSNLYSSHRDIVEKLRKLTSSRRQRHASANAARTKVIKPTEQYEETIAALRCICLELYIELQHEKKQVEALTRALRRRK